MVVVRLVNHRGQVGRYNVGVALEASDSAGSQSSASLAVPKVRLAEKYDSSYEVEPGKEYTLRLFTQAKVKKPYSCRLLSVTYETCNGEDDNC